jgi:hypothetical protein
MAAMSAEPAVTSEEGGMRVSAKGTAAGNIDLKVVVVNMSDVFGGSGTKTEKKKERGTLCSISMGRRRW